MKYIPEKFSIRTITPEISTLIQNRLFANGYRWNAGGVTPDHTEQLWLNIGFRGAKRITFHGASSCDIILTLEEFLALDFSPAPKILGGFPWSISVGVESVNIGCQTLTRTELDTFVQQVQAKRSNPTTHPLLQDPWYIETLGSADLSGAIQRRLFSLGFKWVHSADQVTTRILGPIFSNTRHLKSKHIDGYYHNGGSGVAEIRSILKKITVEELFSTEAEKQDVPFNSLTVSLDKDGLSAEGCTVSWEDFDKFVSEIKE